MRLRTALAAARDRRVEATAEFSSRAAAIEATIAREQRRLDRCIARINHLDDADVSDEDREELAALERDRDNAKKMLVSPLGVTYGSKKLDTAFAPLSRE